jgi:NADPH:quinone reductase
MKAIQVREFGAPEVMKLGDAAEPQPGPGQVLVRLKAAGVNPVDTYIRAGAYGYKPSLPYTPGIDGAGTVEGIGDGVSGFSKGERVYVAGSLSGTYAELALCTAAQVHPLPQKVTFDQGAALGVPYGTAYRALFICGRGTAGETVLVHGASGGVGIAAVQMARAAGLVVIGTAGSTRGREMVMAEGAHHVLDHHAPDYLEQLKTITGGRGVDVILEMLANVNLAKDLPLLAKHGRVVVIGSRGSIEINPRETMIRDASIVGMSLQNASPSELTLIHAALVAGLENSTLRPIVGQQLPLAQAPRAHHAVMEPGAYGKIVLLTLT